MCRSGTAQRRRAMERSHGRCLGNSFRRNPILRRGERRSGKASRENGRASGACASMLALLPRSRACEGADAAYGNSRGSASSRRRLRMKGSASSRRRLRKRGSARRLRRGRRFSDGLWSLVGTRCRASKPATGPARAASGRATTNAVAGQRENGGSSSWARVVSVHDPDVGTV